jgi:Fe2+ or Zn2+ uptake regulation protein
MTRTFLDRAKEMVHSTRARVTRPRVGVLAVLLAARRALTHREVERQVTVKGLCAGCGPARVAHDKA